MVVTVGRSIVDSPEKRRFSVFFYCLNFKVRQIVALQKGVEPLKQKIHPRARSPDRRGAMAPLFHFSKSTMKGER